MTPRDTYGLVGTTLDRRYAVRRVVAEGGYALVYEADALSLGVRVAIKVLRSDLLSSGTEARARFEQEARLLARLKHPAIVELLDAASLENDTPYLALAWIEGETLEARIARRGAHEPIEALRLLAPVASAIAYAHEAGVVHRDLKPANLMVTQGNSLSSHAGDQVDRMKVLDFGIARWATEDGVRTNTISSTGVSVGYAAPEQYGREFGAVDGRADQFALAAIVFAILAGTPPFAAGSITEVMFATCMSEKRPSVSTFRPEIAPAIDAVLRRALSVRPEGRFATLVEFWQALEIAAQVPVSPSLPNSPKSPNTEPTSPPQMSHGGAAPPIVTLPSPELRKLSSGEFARGDGREFASPRQLHDIPRTSGSLPAFDPQLDRHAPLLTPTRADVPSYPSSEPRGTQREGTAPPTSRPPTSGKPSRLGVWVGIIVVLVLLGSAFVLAQTWLDLGGTNKKKSNSSRPSGENSIDGATSPSTSGSASARPSSSGSTSASASVSAGPIVACAAGKASEACVLGGRFVRGPSDCASSGTDPAHRAACPPNETFVATFFLDRHEVTKGSYKACIEASKCSAPPESFAADTEDLPIRGITYKDAAAYCAFDEGRRLPSDEEWELAASGITRREYPWGNMHPTGKLAVFSDDKETRTAPLAGSGERGATPEGISDLAGNLAEWTSTKTSPSAPLFDPAPYGVEAAPVGTRRWVRGGSFAHSWDALRAWSHEAMGESVRSGAIGFRCARTKR